MARYSATVGIVLILGLAFPLTSSAEKEKFGSNESKSSYGIGLNIGASLQRQGLSKDEVDVDALAEGLRDALQGKTPQIDQAVVRAAMEQLNKEREEKNKASAAQAQQAGEKFLAENSKKKGVVTLPSGLQYMVLTDAKGNKPKATDTVKVHYRGTLVDGTEFDSSYSRGQPAEFGLNQVIKGWTEGLQLMSAGAKYRLFVPANLGYGERSPTPKIPANAVLLFDVELLEIK